MGADSVPAGQPRSSLPAGTEESSAGCGWQLRTPPSSTLFWTQDTYMMVILFDYGREMAEKWNTVLLGTGLIYTM